MSNVDTLIKEIRKAANGALPVIASPTSTEGRAHTLIAGVLADLTRLGYEAEHGLTRPVEGD